ncbi:MAG: response regulator [Desulfobacteraceae bacterium]|nr:response regulator [Desulfobacteraceae bacterium]
MSARPKVLIVDDEERFRTTLRKLLGVRDIDASDVGSAREALAEIESNSYDVVLLDVRMPEMNGIEALAKIKKEHPAIEVIILTGHASVDTAVEIMKLGGFEYLLKPCPIDELVGKVESAWERKTSREKRQTGR